MHSRRSLERGDIIYVNFEPQVGREMNYERPAIVISPAAFNRHSDLILVCPITSTIKGSPWEVRLIEDMKTKGVIRVDHLKSIDKTRCHTEHHRVSVKEKAPITVIEEVLSKLEVLVS